MNDKSLELLQQIAIDVAVIKNRLDHFESIQEKVESHSEDLSSLTTQLNVVRWFGGVLGVGILGVLVKVITNQT